MVHWKSVKCLVEGSSHGVDGTPCQDYVDITESGSTIIAVLSDGLGSKRHSEIASKSVVKIVSESLQGYFEEFNNSKKFRQHLIDTCRKAITQSATAVGLQPDEMDCTLLFAAVRGTELVAGQLGDGAICLLQRNSGELFCVPQKGSVANSTMTVFSRDAVESLMIGRFPDIRDLEAVILTSDGLELDFYYPNSKVVRKTAGGYANTVANEKEERATEIIVNRITSLQNAGADDDICVAVISRSNTKVELPDDPTWLCICGNRNLVDVTHCAYCSEDFMDTYSDMDFSQTDKVAFFRDFNGTSNEKDYIEKNREKTQPVREDPRVALDKAIREKIQQDNVNGEPDKCGEQQPLEGYPKEQHERADGAYQQNNESKLERLMSQNNRGYTTQGLLSKMKKDKGAGFNILVCVLVLVALCYFVFNFRTNKIDYNKLPPDNVVGNELAKKSDDIYTIDVQSQQGVNSRQSVSLYADFDSSTYITLIKGLIRKYGDNGVLVIGKSGYISLSDGGYYSGEIALGVPNGKGIMFLANGTTLIGNFDNGKKEGIFLFIDVNRKVSQIVYNNDRLTGGE